MNSDCISKLYHVSHYYDCSSKLYHVSHYYSNKALVDILL